MHVLGTPPAFILSQDQTLRTLHTFTGAPRISSCHSSVVKVRDLFCTLQYNTLVSGCQQPGHRINQFPRPSLSALRCYPLQGRGCILPHPLGSVKFAALSSVVRLIARRPFLSAKLDFTTTLCICQIALVSLSGALLVAPAVSWPARRSIAIPAGDWRKKASPAMTYSPRGLRPKYHRRWRA